MSHLKEGKVTPRTIRGAMEPEVLFRVVDVTVLSPTDCLEQRSLAVKDSTSSVFSSWRSSPDLAEG